ncbi:uncharacterized protein BKA78DRAFT_126315 [Phyllosticta capitalensis]|uniref:uncharacterized protein n=1 Tax=Phyllosticta capitalensis TaxID=121624 RepID=UPI00312F82B8
MHLCACTRRVPNQPVPSWPRNHQHNTSMPLVHTCHQSSPLVGPSLSYSSPSDWSQSIGNQVLPSVPFAKLAPPSPPTASKLGTPQRSKPHLRHLHSQPPPFPLLCHSLHSLGQASSIKTSQVCAAAAQGHVLIWFGRMEKVT